MEELIAQLAQAAQMQGGQYNTDALNAIRLAETQRQADAARHFYRDGYGAWIGHPARVDPNAVHQQIMNGYKPYPTE